MSMSQYREAPAYQEYASTILSKLSFRTLGLAERGLLYTMRLECWVNLHLPSNHNDLAKVLGLSVKEISELLPSLMGFFKIEDNHIICPELEGYRQYLADRKTRQSEGGKLGANKTNQSRKARENSEKNISSSNPTTNLRESRRPNRRGDVESLVQSSKAQQSQNQSLHAENTDSFISDYEKCETSEDNDYLNASKGE